MFVSKSKIRLKTWHTCCVWNIWLNIWLLHTKWKLRMCTFIPPPKKSLYHVSLWRYGLHRAPSCHKRQHLEVAVSGFQIFVKNKWNLLLTYFLPQGKVDIPPFDLSYSILFTSKQNSFCGLSYIEMWFILNYSEGFFWRKEYTAGNVVFGICHCYTPNERLGSLLSSCKKIKVNILFICGHMDFSNHHDPMKVSILMLDQGVY